MSNRAKTIWNIIFFISFFSLSWFLFELSCVGTDNPIFKTVKYHKKKENTAVKE